MTQPGTYAATSMTEYDIVNQPRHFIIWLDQHIGKPDECILLKSFFFMAMNPTDCLYERQLNGDDIYHSIATEAHMYVKLDTVVFMFQAFENIEKCFLTIEKNRNKRIFFITSGSKGRMIVPSIIVNFPETFVEEYWVYVFCANMNMTQVQGCPPPTNTWALRFMDNILMFDHQDDLLARMVLDMGTYFFKEAESLYRNEQYNAAIQHYRWSRIMYLRFGTMERVDQTTKIAKIDELITGIEQPRPQQQVNSDNDDKEGSEASG